MRPKSRCSTAKPIALAPYGEAKFKFDALPPMRLAEPFEALRDRSDAMLKKSGARPKVFLANLGTAADFTARATFAKSFFEAGGIEAIDNEGFADPGSARCRVQGVRRRTSPACARRTRSMPRRRRPPRRPFKAPAQGISIWQAAPASRKPALRAAGIGDFIFAGGDALAALQEAWRRME